MPKPDSRQRILEIASRMFAFQGYDAVTMRHVSTKANMTTANLYYHFKDKDALIRESLAYVFKTKAEYFEGILDAKESPEVTLHHFIQTLTDLFYKDEIFARLFFRELLDADDSRMIFLVKTVFQRPFGALTKVVAQCMEGVDPTLSAISVVGLVCGHRFLAKMARHLDEGGEETEAMNSVAQHIAKVLQINSTM